MIPSITSGWCIEPRMLMPVIDVVALVPICRRQLPTLAKMRMIGITPVRFDNGEHTPPMLDVADVVLDDVELNIVWLNAHAEAVQVLKNCCLADSWQALR